jgi:N-acetylglutamate synthase-like GNAT family acetyltransferase
MAVGPAFSTLDFIHVKKDAPKALSFSSKCFTCAGSGANCPRAMTVPNLQVRRATIEDIARLMPLWQQEDLPWQALEKRFKEFQVVEEPGGELLGALGLEISGAEGRLHSEVFAHPEQADALRDMLWERTQVVAKNHGLVRIWSQFATPFWHHSGFQYAPAETLAKLPATFGNGGQPWQFVQLRDEAVAPISIDKEFAAFKELERENTQKVLRQAKVLKMVAAAVVMAVFILVALFFFSWFKARSHMPR